MQVYVMRHGQTVWNAKGIIQGRCQNRLSKAGKEQVKLASAKFEHVKFDVIFSSPLMRAVQTANIMNEFHHVKIVRDGRIIENDQGIFTRRHKRTLTDEDWKMRVKNPKACEMETREEIFDRVKDFCDYIRQNFNEKSKILVVTHGVVVQMMMYCSKFEHWDVEEFNKFSEPDNAEVREIEI